MRGWRSNTTSKPRAAKWPKADFIVGNPPFIGNKRMRKRLGDGYVIAVRSAYPAVPANVDLVMYWWEKTAVAVRKEDARRFGFMSTNSIKQITNRVVVNISQGAKPPYQLLLRSQIILGVMTKRTLQSELR